MEGFDISDEDFGMIQQASELFHLSVNEERIEEEAVRLWLEYVCGRTYDNMASGRPLFMTPDEKEEAAAKLRTEARQNLLTQKVLDYIISRDQITVTYEEKEDEARSIALRQDVTLEYVKDFLGEDLVLVESDLKYRKALSSLRNHAV